MSNSEDFISEDEDDKSAMQTWTEISFSTNVAEYMEDDVKQSFSDDENDDECEQGECEDPLDENVVDMKITEFQGEYNEADLINEISEDEETTLQTSIAPNRNKKRKTCLEFKSPNGHIWSISKASCKQNIPIDFNCLQSLPKGKGPATKVKNPLEAWYLLLDKPIMSIILQYTNEKIQSIKGKLSYQRRTDLVELRAWLGLNYLCGIFRNTAYPGPLSELWTWELGNSIFRATMSWKRFEFLATCISFSAPISKKSTLQNVLQIKEVWERFLANCRSYYSPSGNCMIRDFIIDINEDKANARLTVLCDAKSLYVCNAIISNQNEAKGTHERIVLHLVTDIKGSNRNIILPEEYTSVDVAQKLKQRKLTLVGALPSESGDVPNRLLEEVDATKYKLYSDVGCLFKCTEANTAPFLLTNCLPGKVAIDRLFSYSNKSWEHFEQGIESFSTKNATCETFNNGPLSLFYHIMDFAALNALILLRLSTSGVSSAPTQREFQRDLGLYLTQIQLKRQLQEKNKLTLPQKLQISEVLGEPTEKLLADACEKATKNTAAGFVPTEKLDLPKGVVLRCRTLERRKRCCVCIKYQTRTRCQQCLRALCHRHLIARCNDCMGVTELPE